MGPTPDGKKNPETLWENLLNVLHDSLKTVFADDTENRVRSTMY